MLRRVRLPNISAESRQQEQPTYNTTMSAGSSPACRARKATPHVAGRNPQNVNKKGTGRAQAIGLVTTARMYGSREVAHSSHRQRAE